MIKTKQIVGKLATGTPEKVWLDEFIFLKDKAYSFECDDKDTNKLIGVSKSQSMNTDSEDCYIYLFGGEYQKECDQNYILSVNHELYPQKLVEKLTIIF